LYKKGDIESCDNYRPISLISVTYKLLATLLLKRLQDAGAEDRLTESQYGFRRHRGTVDAIHAARCFIELAWAQRGGHIALLALDWAKAFDSLDTGALKVAPVRLGVPADMVDFIANIYDGRKFRVLDEGGKSTARPQLSGISQGCPLSPFLFVMAMSVIMHDALLQLPAEDKELLERSGHNGPLCR
jgi:hypothetical protein